MKCANCGKDLIPGALFCASCGAKVPKEIPTPAVTEGGKTKKIHTRLIGIIAVAVVVAAVGFGGFKGWKWFHPDVEKQLVYCKNGALYYTGNMDKEKDPVKVYDAYDDDAYFDAYLSKDQKYLFFRNGKDIKSGLYRVKTQNLTSDASKNKKYIEEIDEDVFDFEPVGSGKVLYYRIGKNKYNDLYYYDGKSTHTVDGNVIKLYRADDILYYFKNNKSDTYGNDTLCYYNLSNQEQGEIGAGNVKNTDVACSYNEKSILYAKGVDRIESGADDTEIYDLYLAEPGGPEKKIVSGVVSCNGDVDSGNIYYEKMRQQRHTYYECVKDPYEKQDENVSGPDLEDYLHPEYVYDILDGYMYDFYWDYEYKSEFIEDYGSYDEVIGDYVYYYGGDSYIQGDDDYEWYRVDDSYYADMEKYDEVCSREELREQLKSATYGSDSYDLYFYNAKSGEKKIAESVILKQADPKNEICNYKKIEEKKVKKVCSIDDISSLSDLKKELGDSDQQDDTVYVSAGGQEQKLENVWVEFKCSEDGKTIMAKEVFGSDYKLAAYTKKGDRLEKIGIIGNNINSYSYFDGNDFYYIDDDKALYVYSDGKKKKIVDNVYIAEMQKDGYCVAYGINSENRELKIIDPAGNKATIRNIGDDSDCSYIGKNRIVYLKEDELYMYDGKDSRKIDRDVDDFWCMNRLSGESE